MSRAFVSENGGWSFCRKKRQSCTYAESDGGCIFSKCRIEQEAAEKMHKQAAEENSPE